MEKYFYYRLADSEDCIYDHYLVANKECGKVINIFVEWWGDISMNFDEDEYNNEYYIEELSHEIKNRQKATELVERYVKGCKENDGDLGAITDYICENLEKIGIECHEIELNGTFDY